MRSPAEVKAQTWPQVQELKERLQEAISREPGAHDAEPNSQTFWKIHKQLRAFFSLLAAYLDRRLCYVPAKP